MMVVQYAARLLEAQWRNSSINPVVWAPDPPLRYALVCILSSGPKCIGTRVRSGSQIGASSFVYGATPPMPAPSRCKRPRPPDLHSDATVQKLASLSVWPSVGDG